MNFEVTSVNSEFFLKFNQELKELPFEFNEAQIAKIQQVIDLEKNVY